MSCREGLRTSVLSSPRSLVSGIRHACPLGAHGMWRGSAFAGPTLFFLVGGCFIGRVQIQVLLLFISPLLNRAVWYHSSLALARSLFFCFVCTLPDFPVVVPLGCACVLTVIRLYSTHRQSPSYRDLHYYTFILISKEEMRFTDIGIAAMVAPLVAAHGESMGMPKIIGLPRDLEADFKAPVAARVLRHAAEPKGGLLETRQGGQNGRCGAAFGNAKCAAGYCCSGAGYCGTTKDHCLAPDCQMDFGPACDANKAPGGATTRNDARPQKGNVAYGGSGVYACQKAGTVAITYDDG